MFRLRAKVPVKRGVADISAGPGDEESDEKLNSAFVPRWVETERT